MVKFLLLLVGSLCLNAACHNRVVIEHATEIGTAKIPYRLDSISVGNATTDADTARITQTILKVPVSAEMPIEAEELNQ